MKNYNLDDLFQVYKEELQIKARAIKILEETILELYKRKTKVYHKPRQETFLILKGFFDNLEIYGNSNIKLEEKERKRIEKYTEYRELLINKYDKILMFLEDLKRKKD